MDEKKEVSYFSHEDSPIDRRITSILRALSYAGVGIVIVLMMMTVVHATGRYAFDHPLRGNTELSGMMVITIAFFIMAYTQLEKGHIMIGVIVDRFSVRTQVIIDTVTYFLCLVFVIVSLWRSVVQAFYETEVVHRTTILGIPQFPFVFFIAFGWGLIALALILQLVRSLPQAIRGVKK